MWWLRGVVFVIVLDGWPDTIPLHGGQKLPKRGGNGRIQGRGGECGIGAFGILDSFFWSHFACELRHDVCVTVTQTFRHWRVLRSIQLASLSIHFRTSL